jgi:hypothetical protein
MPLYAYEDPETGVKIEIRRPVKDRGKPIVLRRLKTVPDRLAVVGLGPTSDQEFNARIKRNLHKKEEREGSRFKSGYSKKTLSKAWS